MKHVRSRSSICIITGRIEIDQRRERFVSCRRNVNLRPYTRVSVHTRIHKHTHTYINCNQSIIEARIWSTFLRGLFVCSDVLDESRIGN